MPDASRRRSGSAFPQVADFDDPAAFHANVGRDAGRTGAVDYGAAADHEVDHVGLPSGSLMGREVDWNT